mgnify:CR=1 FL=1
MLVFDSNGTPAAAAAEAPGIVADVRAWLDSIDPPDAAEFERRAKIDQVVASPLIVTVNWVGTRTPVHCTSNGKVLLAHMPEPERQQLLARPLEAVTARTVTDPARLRRQLEEVRARGYATIQDELEEGLNAVAAPVRRLSGEVIAALSISGPSFRVRAVDLARLGRLTIDAAGAVSRRLGYTGRRGD